MNSSLRHDHEFVLGKIESLYKYRNKLVVDARSLSPITLVRTFTCYTWKYSKACYQSKFFLLKAHVSKIASQLASYYVQSSLEVHWQSPDGMLLRGGTNTTSAR